MSDAFKRRVLGVVDPFLSPYEGPLPKDVTRRVARARLNASDRQANRYAQEDALAVDGCTSDGWRRPTPTEAHRVACGEEPW